MLDTLLLSVSAVVVYSNLNWFVPVYLSRQKYSTYFIFLLPTLVTAGFVFSVILSLIGDLSKITEWENYYSFNGWLTSTIFISMIVMITTMLKFTKEWFVQQRTTAEMEKVKLRSELNFLKNQLNPSFLFNTLDELQILAEKGSDKAPDMVLKLSEVLRYILYDGSKAKVPLQRELNFIKNYIELEKMRLKDNSQVNFNIQGIAEQQSIYPLIVLPYVSEAFKHFERQDNGSSLDLEVSVDGEKMNLQIDHFKAMNDLTPSSPINIVEKANQRLELLYPDQYNMELIPGKEHITLDLTIDLHE